MPAGRPRGSPNKDKPFRDALRIEAALAEQGKDSPAPKGSLRPFLCTAATISLSKVLKLAQGLRHGLKSRV